MNKFAAYDPIRNYHTRRVRNLRGKGLIERFWFLYEYDGEFRINVDLLAGITFAFVAAISIVTILFLCSMSRIMQEPQQHIHDNLVEEVNEMSIRIKLGIADIKQSNVNRQPPTWQEVADLLDKVIREMNQCTKPLKLH